MNLNNIKFWLLIFLLTISIQLHASEPKFKSELFKTGKLVYSDDFDGELNRERWGQPKGKSIKDGKLTVFILNFFTSLDEVQN